MTKIHITEGATQANEKLEVQFPTKSIPTPPARETVIPSKSFPSPAMREVAREARDTKGAGIPSSLPRNNAFNKKERKVGFLKQVGSLLASGVKKAYKTISKPGTSPRRKGSLKFLKNKKVIGGGVAILSVFLLYISGNVFTHFYEKIQDSYYITEIKYTYTEINKEKEKKEESVKKFNRQIAELEKRLSVLQKQKADTISIHDSIIESKYATIDTYKTQLNDQFQDWNEMESMYK